MTFHYFATVAKGLEAIAALELESLGAKNVKTTFTGVSFKGDRELLYKVNLWSRTIFRVLQPIKTIEASNPEQLYQQVQTINWQDYLTPDNTLAVNCTGKNQKLNHTHFNALQIKNAIIDQQRQQTGQRSSIDVNKPDILINGHIYQNQCTLSLDSSGDSLHRRGYRPAMGVAPLKETLAAALLLIAQWEPTIPFLDPLCGSGTLPLEAAMKGLNIAPGLYRQQFAFQTWSDFDDKLWQKVLKEAKESQLSELSIPIVGGEANREIIQQARHNAKLCGVGDKIQLLKQELAQIEPPADSGIIITNPPYGKRIGEVAELASLYKLLGDVLKQRFKGWKAYILTGNKELAKKIGLRASRRIPVYNGSLPCTLLEYELY
jgi:putative N6-adenine-specific DNA methylase